MANRYVTKRGIARYPKTDRTYKWSEAANRSVPDPDGEYELSLVMSPEDAAREIERIDDYKKANNLKVKKLPYKPEVDKESGDETGNVVFTFKQYGKDKSGEVRKIFHYDSKRRKLPDNFKLTNGSTVVVEYHPTNYKAQGGGIKLYLDSIQVIDYIPPQGGGAFEEVEDGFVFEETAQPAKVTTDSEDTYEDEDDGVPF